jgi:hypothetical protein
VIVELPKRIDEPGKCEQAEIVRQDESERYDIFGLMAVRGTALRHKHNMAVAHDRP